MIENPTPADLIAAAQAKEAFYEGAIRELTAAHEQKVADLMTIVDFCDALDGKKTGVVLMAHILGHHITDDPDREVPAAMVQTMRVYCGLPDSTSKYGRAWPDVRRRMLDLLGRVQ